MLRGDGSGFGSWLPQGGDTFTGPTVAINDQTGHVLVSYVDEGAHPNYRAFDGGGNPLGDWSQDITGYQTTYSVTLSGVGNAIYAILTGLDHLVYYKQVYNG